MFTGPSSGRYGSLSTAAQDDAGFFTLPRELRDDIYHQAFSMHCCLYRTYLPGVDWCEEYSYKFDLCYTYGDTPRKQNTISENDKPTYPTWLLACKTILHEGTVQYLRHAKWVQRGCFYESVAGRRLWSTHFVTLGITRLELQIGGLAHYETPPQNVGLCTGATRITGCIRAAQICMSTVRFVGHSYRLREWPQDPTCSGQIEHMMRNLKKLFSGVQVKKWELGIVGRPADWMWVLYEWADDATSTGPVLLTDNRMDLVLRAEWAIQVEQQRACQAVKDNWVHDDSEGSAETEG